jgi:precorrin-4 methylase
MEDCVAALIVIYAESLEHKEVLAMFRKLLTTTPTHFKNLSTMTTKAWKIIVS